MMSHLNGTAFVKVQIKYQDGTEDIISIPFDQGNYPLGFRVYQRDWVLAKRPGVAENIDSIYEDGSLGPAASIAEYCESYAVDAVCLDCGVRTLRRYHADADKLLRRCIKRGHITMLLPLHLGDTNVVDFLSPPRTVGDIRESTTPR